MNSISLPVVGRPYVRIDAADGAGLVDLDVDRLLALYREHGAILLSGFAGGLDAFHSLARRLCPLSIHNDSRNRARLGAAGEVQTVNLGTRPFPLHPELSREPWKPDSCFFFCLTPPSRSGATTLCDGVAIVDALPAELVDEMAARRITYIQQASPDLLEYWLGTRNPTAEQLAAPPPACPFIFKDRDGQIVRCFSAPLLHRPMFTDRLAFGNFLLFARYMKQMIGFPLLDDGSVVPDAWLEAVRRAGERLTAALQWRANDLLILDNSRFMHGRTEVAPNDQRLIATYFGYLKDAPSNPEEPVDPVWRKPGFMPPAA